MDEGPRDTGVVVRTSFVLAALAVVGGLVALLVGVLGHGRGSDGFDAWIGVSIWLLAPGACLAMLTLLVVHRPRGKHPTAVLEKTDGHSR